MPDTPQPTPIEGTGGFMLPAQIPIVPGTPQSWTVLPVKADDGERAVILVVTTPGAVIGILFDAPAARACADALIEKSFGIEIARGLDVPRDNGNRP
jgi:hypothetical protein